MFKLNKLFEKNLSKKSYRNAFFAKGKLLSTVFVVMLALILTLPSCKKNEMREDIVGMVASENIEEYEFRFSLAATKDIMLSNEGIEKGTPEEDEFWEQENDGIKNIDKAKQDALNDLKQLKILSAMAAEDNLSLTEDELKEIDENIDSQIENYYGGDKAEMEKTILENYNVTFDEYKLLFQLIMLQNKAYTEKIDTMEISDEEIEAEYENLKDSYETVTVKHVLINYEGTEEKTRTSEESQALADEVLGKLNNGEDMDALVAEYSEDPGAAYNGGEYTFSRTDNYVESFIDWGFSATDGDTGIIESPYGYHIMQYISRQTKPLDEVKDDIAANLKDTKFEQMLQEAMEDPKYDVKVNDKVFDAIR